VLCFLRTWQCLDSPATAAEHQSCSNQSISPAAGPIAANLQQWVCCCGPMLWQDRHHTIMLTLLCILYRQCQKVTISSAPSLRVYNNPFVCTVLHPIWKPSHCQYHGEFYTRLIKSCIKLPELFKTCWLISAWHVHIIISPLQWTTLAKIPEVKYPFPSITNTADKNSQMFILHYSEEFLIFKHSDATVNT